jgi:phage replication initiation protein
VSKTSVDFYAFRTKENRFITHKALEVIFADHAAQISTTRRKVGWNGYERSYGLSIGDMPVGLIAEGGDSQRGWTYVGISGQGCALVNDWDLAQEAASCCDSYETKRVDIALDTYDKTGFDGALAAYRAGSFNTGGRNPKCEPMKPERWEDSAIIRIGDRKSAKYYRGYEKGKQLLGPSISAARDKDDFDPVEWAQHATVLNDGADAVSVNTLDWFRHEVEFKPKAGPLPVDLIDRRDEYFAGAYPYLGTLLEGVEAKRFVAKKNRAALIELDRALEFIRTQYGSILFTALTVHKGDVAALMGKIIGKKHSKTLLEAGLLLSVDG